MSEDQEKWMWWSGPNDELYTNGPYLTREEALEALDGGWGYIVEAVSQKLRFSAEDMLETQYFENDDLFSGEGPNADRIGDNKDADAELQALLDEWTAKWAHTFISPTRFKGHRIEEAIEAQWNPVGTDPADYWVEVRTEPDAEFTYTAKWLRQRRWTDEDGQEQTGQWVAKDLAPPCWTDGLCWAVNEAGEPSGQPVEWRELP